MSKSNARRPISRRRNPSLSASRSLVAAESLEVRRLLSGDLSILANFGANNSYSDTLRVVVDNSGNVFGTDYSGGSNSSGEVFEVASGSGTVTSLVSFTGGNGSTPEGGVTLDSNGNLFGTTFSGGDGGYGTIFEIAHGSTTLRTLVTLNGSGPNEPIGGLLFDGSGDLFGRTSGGGTNGNGTIFELAAGTNTPTVLASFSQSDSFSGYGTNLVMDSSGNLYGATATGGSANLGSIFELPAGSNTITTLVNFDGTFGDYPYGDLSIDPNGSLFGTTESGAANSEGAVFELPHGSSNVTTLASFDGSNGSFPLGGVTIDGSGNLFGTTYGGPSGYGTVFGIAAGTTTINNLANFDGTTTGSYPYGGVAIGPGGNLFGATFAGGTNGTGTVFEVSNITFSPAVPPPPPSPLALDPTFGANGTASVAFTSEAQTSDSAGNILLAGYQGDPSAGTARTVLERLNPDGTPDSSFGSGGTIVGQADSGAFYSVQIESSGQIVAAGTNPSGQFLLERFTSSGAPDASFGSSGIATANLGAGSVAYSLAVDSSGNLLAAGTGANRFAIARFTSSGALDSTFNSTGTQSFNVGSDDVLSKVLIQPDGKILLAGGSGANDVVVARLNADGSFDSTFGGTPSAGIALVSGLVPTDIAPGVPDAGIAMALEVGGTILVANQATDGHFGVAALTPAGTLDATFGSGGLAEANFAGASETSTDDADAISIDPSTGELLVAGTTNAGGIPQTALAQFLPTGTLDTSFGSSGMLMLPADTQPTGSASPALSRGGLVARPDAYYGKDFYAQAFLSLQTGGKALVGNSGGPNKSSTIRRLAPNSATPLVNNSQLAASVSGTLPAAPMVAGRKIRPISQRVTITNPTSATVSGVFTIQLLLSGNTTGNTADPVLGTVTRRFALRASRSVSVPITFRALPAGVSGSQYMLAEVTDPSSNTAIGASSGTISVQSPYVDLGGGFARVPASGKSGRPVSMTLGVTEGGNVQVSASLPIQVFASADGKLDVNAISLGTVTRHVSIQPGHKMVVQISIPLGSLAAGSYTLIAQLDPANTLSDADLANNIIFSNSPIAIT